MRSSRSHILPQSRVALAFLDKAGALRLPRAYASIRKPRMKRALVELAEQIAKGLP